jgi:hypothetical protein
LFNNETAPYGETPSASLYSEYWSTYVDLLYNPVTRVINCKAIIPLADYYKIELNDIVEWRGNYYHIRAINDYNLSNGECNLQLLGPTIGDVLANILPGQQCDFDFSIEDYTPPTNCSSSFSWSLVSNPYATPAAIEIDVNGTTKLYSSGSHTGNFALAQSSSIDIFGGSDTGVHSGSYYSMSVKQNGTSIYEYFGNLYGETHFTSSCTASYQIFVSSSYSSSVPSYPYWEVQLCSGGSTYIIETSRTPEIGKSYTINQTACLGSMDGVNCWTVINSSSATPDCTNVDLGAEYTNCYSCSISSCNEYKIGNPGIGEVTWHAWSCNNIYRTGTVPAGEIRYTGCVQSETLVVTGGGTITLFAYC